MSSKFSKYKEDDNLCKIGIPDQYFFNYGYTNRLS